MRRWKQFLPVFVSAGLVAWLLWRIDLEELREAFLYLDWGPVVAVTAALVAVLFVWDGVCIWWLFDDRERPIRYGTALQARGCAYLFTILHFGLGQGLLVWMVAKAQDRSFLSTAGRTLILAFVDVGVLLALGSLGAALSDDPRTDAAGVFCGLALLGLVVATIIVLLLPARAKDRLKATKWGAEIALAHMTWRRMAPLYVLRLIYFLVGMLHAGTVLWLVGIRLDYSVVASVIPLTALVDGLPISFAGLGTRETMLIALLRLHSEKAAALLAGSFVWWFVVQVSRAGIGLALLWLPSTRNLLAGRGKTAP